VTRTRRAALEARGLSQSYGGEAVLDGVSLSVEPGRVHTVVGANGSGKTTVLKALAGLLEPDSGVIETHTDADDREVGYLPQQPSFRSGFTVEETVRFYARLLGADESRVGCALDAVGLSSEGDERVSALSGGMRRLLGVAQSRVGEPPIMLLDEPTSGLDPGMTERIFGVLEGAADEGASVLITTHDLDAVERYADTVFLIEDGCVSASGAPEEVADECGVDGLVGLFAEKVGGGPP